MRLFKTIGESIAKEARSVTKEKGYKIEPAECCSYQEVISFYFGISTCM